MSKLTKKESFRLKFDTSQANLQCFINKRPRISSHEDKKISRRKNKSVKSKPVQFLPEPFLTSVLTQGLAEDFACQKEIKELVLNKINDQDQYNKEDQKEDLKDSPYHADHCVQNILSPSSNWAQDWQGIIDCKDTYLPNHMSSTRMGTQQTYTDPSIRSKQASYNMTPQSNLSFEEDQQQKYMVYYQNGGVFYQNQQQQNKPRFAYNDQSNLYEISLDRIQLKGKTTIMIRNIPNKYTQAMLVEELNRNHKHKYNFFYLPIDYNNNCNVGYAFVNFIHTKFIHSFYEQFNGRKWNKFNSQKICSLTYARIQGTASLLNLQNANNYQRDIKKNKPVPEMGQQIYSCLSKIVEEQRQEKY